MNATEYLTTHWARKKTWKNLALKHHQRRFVNIAAYLKGETFADVGCAFGHSTHYLKERTGGEWTGIEFDEAATIKARGLFPDIDFKYVPDTGKLCELPKFDGVVCSEVIEHVEHDQRLIDSLVAITGKTLVITTPNIEVNDPGHLRVYDEAILRALFERYGEIEINKVHKFFYVIFRAK